MGQLAGPRVPKRMAPSAQQFCGLRARGDDERMRPGTSTAGTDIGCGTDMGHVSVSNPGPWIDRIPAYHHIIPHT